MAKNVSVFKGLGVPGWLRAIAGVMSLGLSEATNGISTAWFNNKVGHKMTDEDWSEVKDQMGGSFFQTGADIVGGGLNGLTGVSQSQRYQTDENDRQLQRELQLLEAQQGWSERMSNTAIQRQVADAKAAGINPLYFLGSNSGAGVSNPSGGTAAPAGAVGGNSAAAVSSAISTVGSIVAMLLKSK